MHNTTLIKLAALYVLLTMANYANTALITEAGVSKEEQNQVLRLHNDFRLKLQKGKIPNQPRSTNIKLMCWDDLLAEEAQKIANTTLYKHVNVIDKRWAFVGQNLAQSASTWETIGSNWTWAVTSWQEEVNLYKYPDSATRQTGHYTQAVWATTTHVGCGYVNYVAPHQKLKFKKFYVCNYGPSGNINGRAPYKTGRCGCVGLCKAGCKPCMKKKT